MADNRVKSESLPRDLGDGLVLRRATTADTEALVAFNGLIHAGPNATEPDLQIAAWVSDLMSGEHPTFDPSDFLIVEDTRTNAIVSSTNLISQTWSYSGVEFGCGRPELVGTLAEYRNRGLVRAQFEVLHGWSAERGEQVQAITGIPWYYRQFGYEMTLPLWAGRFGYRSAVPPLKEGEAEPYTLRAATNDDVPFISQVYNHAMKRYLVACKHDETSWRYELSGRSVMNVQRNELRIIEAAGGEPVGFLRHGSSVWGNFIAATAYELTPGVSWGAVTPSVLRYLWATGERLAEERKRTDFSAFGFMMGTEHPVYDTIPDRLPRKPNIYAWYVRVPDMPGFLRHVSPVLERRIAESYHVGHTGELKLNFYRDGVRLAFENGRLTTCEAWKPAHPEDGDAAFPDQTFLHLLFGYRTMDDLEYAFSDCRAATDQARVLLGALFPREPSFIIPVG